MVDLLVLVHRFAYTVEMGLGADLREIRVAIQVGVRPGKPVLFVEITGVAMRLDRLAVMAPTTRSAGLIRSVT